MVYSVGENGVDDGGSDDVVRDRNSEYFNSYKDFVLHLRGVKRTAPADYFAGDGLRYRIPFVVPAQASSSEKR